MYCFFIISKKNYIAQSLYSQQMDVKTQKKKYKSFKITASFKIFHL